MYVSPNFKTKKALKEAVAAGQAVTVFQPNAIFANSEPPENGTVHLEGPHYPQAHTWYAQGKMENGKLVKIK